MTFSASGFTLQATEVKGMAFLHDLEGNGSPGDLYRFFRNVFYSLADCTAFLTTPEPKKARLYKRFGFVEFEGGLVKFPIKV